MLCSCIFRLVFIFLESQNLAVSLDTPSGPITPIHASICIWQLWKFFIADLFVTEPCIYLNQRWWRKMKIFVNTFNKANPIYVGRTVYTVGRLSTSSSFHRKAWEAVPPKLPFTLFKCEHRVEKAIVRLGGWKHNLPNKPYNLQCRGLPFLGHIE